MSRYIEADAVEKAICKRVYAVEVEDILAEMANAPSIDIVRCKECRWWINNLALDDTDEAYDACRWDWHKDNPKADDYCSYGERKNTDITTDCSWK